MTTNGHRKRGRGVRALIPDLAEPEPLRAELGQATALLRQLTDVLTRAGGYMLPEDQDALRAARAFLVDRAK